ncbi:aldo/keto reductase [Streptomyces sp. PU-14G]|uniref:aldo/keto reductase n=1 Tax=Streptomyces sp. PU-14G TaxID=2800808 RepID=UPI0034DE4286
MTTSSTPSTPSTPSSDPTTAAGVPRAGGPGRLAGRTVSRVGYGAMQLERLNGDRGSALALLRRAVELGVDHVDTAQFYGDGFVNGLIREALRPEDGVLVVSKVGATADPGGRFPLRLAQRPEELRAEVEANLGALGLDPLPVVNLRRAETGPGLRAEGAQVVDIDDQLAVLTALRDEGKIGRLGISNVGPEELRRALPVGLVCVQNSYSLVSRGDEDMLGICLAEDIAWVPYFPLGSAFPGMPKVTDEPAVLAAAQALGATPSQVGLAWLLHHAPHTLLIPGTADAAHLEANVAAGALTLDDATLAALDAVPSRSGEPTFE